MGLAYRIAVLKQAAMNWEDHVFVEEVEDYLAYTDVVPLPMHQHQPP